MHIQFIIHIIPWDCMVDVGGKADCECVMGMRVVCEECSLEVASSPSSSPPRVSSKRCRDHIIHNNYIYVYTHVHESSHTAVSIAS